MCALTFDGGIDGVAQRVIVLDGTKGDVGANRPPVQLRQVRGTLASVAASEPVGIEDPQFARAAFGR
jgi:hypothetical protein